MAATRALLLLFTSAFLFYSLYKLTPFSETITRQDFQDFIDALTIFRSNQIEPKFPDPEIFTLTVVGSEVEVLDETQGWPVIDENDVVVLTGKNFSEFVDKNRYVVVMFYAPWCYWSRKLAPNFEAAARLLKGETTEAVLAMVDAIAETSLGAKYRIDGYPTMYLFVDGVNKYLYDNEMTREAISTWVKSKMAIGIHNLTTMEEAEHIFTSESELVLGVLDSLEGSDSEEFAAASKLQNGINFYRTVSANIAELFLLVPQVKRPALILKMPRKSYRFDGEFTRSAIADFVSTRKLPPVITFTIKDATSIFQNPLKQLWLFAPRNASEVVCTFEEAAEAFRGKLLFVHVDLDKGSIVKELAHRFGAKQDSPTVVGYNTRDSKKHDVFIGELTLNNIMCFAEDFLKNKLLKQLDPASETVLKLPSQSHASHQLHLHM